MPAKIKREKGSWTLEEGKGVIVLTRVMTDGQSYGNVQEFSYNGNSTQEVVKAIQMARGEIDIELAKAAAAPKAAPAKPAAATAPAPKTEAGEDADESADADESTDTDESVDDNDESVPASDWQQTSLL